MNAKCWKRMGLIGSIALTLSASSMNVRAHGGGCYGPCFWPFLPLVFGLGAAVASAASTPSYGYHVYVHAPPAYTYSASAVSAPTRETTPTIEAAQPLVWIPSTPGVGHWVPDATPYNAQVAPAPGAQKAKSANAAQVVTFTHSAGNVPVVVVSR